MFDGNCDVRRFCFCGLCVVCVWLSVVRCLSFVGCHFLFVVHCLLFVVRCVLDIVSFSMCLLLRVAFAV